MRGLAALVLLVPVLVAEVAGVGAGGELPVAGQDGEQQEGEQEAAHILRHPRNLRGEVLTYLRLGGGQSESGAEKLS